MELYLKGKVAIVGASSKGLGRASAESLASEGVNLTIFSRTESDIESTANEINAKYNVEVLPIVADASNTDDIKKVVSSTVEKFKTVDIIVSNAGGPPFGFLNDFNLDDWRKALDLNLLSTVNLTKLVIPYMIKQNWGRIINITSVAVKQPINGLILSNTARSGIIAFAKSVSNEYAANNITINNICPGRILTDRIIHLANQRAKLEKISYEKAIENMEEDIPTGRLGKAE